LFALRTLKKYSGVDIPDDVMQPWAQGDQIPARPQVFNPYSPFSPPMGLPGMLGGFNPWSGNSLHTPIAEIPEGYAKPATIEGNNIVAKSLSSNDRLVLGTLSGLDCLGIRAPFIENMTSPSSFSAWKSSNCKPADDGATATDSHQP